MDFGTVIIAICLLAILAGVVSLFVGGPSPYESIGRGSLTFDEPASRRSPPAAGGPASAESDAEIRQMLQAKSDRRERRGEEPLDIDAELAALTRPAPAQQDPGLREEVRQVVLARNERRLARGEEPLEVEAETDRQLQDLGG